MRSDHNHQPASDLPRSIGAPAQRARAAAGYTPLAQLTSTDTAVSCSEKEEYDDAA